MLGIAAGSCHIGNRQSTVLLVVLPAIHHCGTDPRGEYCPYKCGQMPRRLGPGRVCKAPDAGYRAAEEGFQRALPHAGRRRAVAKPAPKPRGKETVKETVLRLQRLHTPQSAKDKYGGKFVTPYESEATEPIGGIKAEWPTHDARNGDVLVLKEQGTDRVRRPVPCAIPAPHTNLGFVPA